MTTLGVSYTSIKIDLARDLVLTTFAERAEAVERPIAGFAAYSLSSGARVTYVNFNDEGNID